MTKAVESAHAKINENYFPFQQVISTIKNTTRHWFNSCRLPRQIPTDTQSCKNSTFPPTMDTKPNFKTCSCCGESWLNQADFLADPSVSFIGHQHFYEEGVEGLFLFNHTCGTTFSIEVENVKNSCLKPVTIEIPQNKKRIPPSATASPMLTGHYGIK